MDLKTAIYRYCNYQERCHQEVKNKLYELGANTTEVNNLMADLIEANLLNEERYARAYARGKFRLKRWGRVKIVQELKRNRISEYCLKKAMTEIDSEEYYQTLVYLAGRKWSEWQKEKNLFIRKGKVFRYLVQKGFEADLVTDAMREVMSEP